MFVLLRGPCLSIKTLLSYCLSHVISGSC